MLLVVTVGHVCYAQQPPLQITSPSDGTVVNPGQTLTVSVTSPANASFSGVLVIAENPIGSSAAQTSVPAGFSITIPGDIDCGSHMLTAMGSTTSGQTVQSATVMIDVERPDMPTALSAQMPASQVTLDALGQQFHIILFAAFSDGSVLTVTQSSYVTYASSNTAIATVDANGTVTGISAGTATITATYTLSGQSVQTTLSITVAKQSMDVSPTTLDFGSLNVGASSSSQQLTVTNATGGPMKILSVAAGGDFSETDNCGTSSPLQPGATCEINVTLTPAGAASYGLNGRVVNGIAADGVSEIVIRVPAKNVGDQFTFTLLNDANAASASTQNDGALGNPGGTTFTQNQVTVSAINLTAADRSQSAYAFAVYQAPIDFVRAQSEGSYLTGTQHYYAISSGFSPPCGGPWNPCTEGVNFGSLQPAARTDDQLASRSVTIQVQDLSSGNTFSMPVEILRPPVVLIHGLWANWTTWNDFSPLVSGPGTVDPRFYIGRVNYDRPVLPTITATDPPYSQSQMQDIHQNSLGFIYNAPLVLGDVEGWIDNFKDGNNPIGIPAAAVQADIIAHSMGGDIARTFVLQPTFLAPQTFGQGSIHKLITIDTPHLGSPLATDLGSPGEKSGCAATLLALLHKYVLNSIAVGGGFTFPGAIADLSPGSFALSQIANQNQHPIPTALIAGVNPTFVAPDVLAIMCSAVGDPLGQADLSGTNWSSLFNGQPNDAIVTEASQLAGLISAGDVFSGMVHSPSIEIPGGFGFKGPSVLDHDSATGIPSTVIKLLNTSIRSSDFVFLNP